MYSNTSYQAPAPVPVAPAPQPMAQEQPKAEPKPKATPKSKAGDLGGFIQQMTSVAAYVHQLQIQAHLIHLNYEASNFIGIHSFLKDQYEAHLEQFDTIGELIRSMDYLMPMCHEGLMTASPEFKHCTSYKANDMLMTYYKNLEELGMKAKKMEQQAAKIQAPDVQNYFADLCGMAFKAAWFIKASLRNS